MTQERLSVFGDTGDLDLSTFKPQKSKKLKPAREKVRAVTEAASFPSREGTPPTPEQLHEPPVSEPLKRKPRYHTTGRTAQLNCRVMPAIHNRIYEIKKTGLSGKRSNRRSRRSSGNSRKRQGRGRAHRNSFAAIPMTFVPVNRSSLPSPRRV